MGIFAEWQPRYAERGIPTFPVRAAEKCPAVKGYLRIGAEYSRQLVLKFGEANAIGFAVGVRSRITVLDVDTPDESVLADALRQYGETPVIIRSGSGNHQAWYRHAGEGRRIRISGKPIDILGSGYVVAPPSLGARGTYTFVQGRLDDVERLPVMRRVPGPVERCAGATPTGTGDRNNTLWRFAMRRAQTLNGKAALLDAVVLRNANLMAPLEKSEVQKIVASAWGYTERGENRFGAPPAAFIEHSLVDTLATAAPDALVLLVVLERHHSGAIEFFLANAMARKFGWGPLRFRDARNRLEGEGIIHCIRRGGRGPHDPPIYGWT